MLKKMSIKKIIVSSTAILLLLILYLIPDNKKEANLKNDSIEYTYNNVISTIYLIDSNDYVARTTIPTCKCEKEDLAKDLVEGLIIGGQKNNIIPNGFRSIIPPDVSIKNIELKDKILTIDFSKELLEVNKKDEEKMIEAIIYTLTSIDGIDKVIIKVEGEVLSKLPNSKINLPTVLDKSYGINKNYDLTNLNNIISYTTYYTSTYNDSKYYVPVTKYINSKDIKMQIALIAIIVNIIVFSLKEKRENEVSFFIESAEKIKTRPELVFYKIALYFFENIVNYHLTKNEKYYQRSVAAKDLLINIDMTQYGKVLEKLLITYK